MLLYKIYKLIRKQSQNPKNIVSNKGTLKCLFNKSSITSNPNINETAILIIDNSNYNIINKCEDYFKI